MLLPDITTGIVNDFHHIIHTVGHFGTYLAETNPGQTLNDDPSGSDWFPAQLKNSIRALLLLGFNPIYYLAALAAKLIMLASRAQVGTIVTDGWYNTMSYVNILAIMFLMALALANALKINLDTYQIKKTLPALVVGFLLANFSMLGCKAALDFNDILVSQINSQANCKAQEGCSLAGSILEMMTGVALPTKAPTDEDAKKNVMSVIESMGSDSKKTFVKLGLVDGAKQLAGDVKTMTPTAFVSGMLLAILVYLPVIIVFLLALVLLGRQIVILILVILAPLAILCFFFPPTKELGKKWLNTFIQWAFMPAIVFFILSLAAWFGENGRNALSAFTGFPSIDQMPAELQNMGNFVEGAVIYISGLFLLVAALLFPMQVSGLGGLITQLGMAYMYRNMYGGGGAMGAAGQAGNLLGSGTDVTAATQSAAGKGMPGINRANMTPAQIAAYDASQMPINKTLSNAKFLGSLQKMGGIVDKMERGNIKSGATSPEIPSRKKPEIKGNPLNTKPQQINSPFEKNASFNKNLNALKQAINSGDSKQAEALSKQLLETADAKQLMQLSDYYNTLTPQSTNFDFQNTTSPEEGLINTNPDQKIISLDSEHATYKMDKANNTETFSTSKGTISLDMQKGNINSLDYSKISDKPTNAGQMSKQQTKELSKIAPTMQTGTSYRKGSAEYNSTMSVISKSLTADQREAVEASGTITIGKTADGQVYIAEAQRYETLSTTSRDFLNAKTKSDPEYINTNFVIKYPKDFEEFKNDPKNSNIPAEQAPMEFAVHQMTLTDMKKLSNTETTATTNSTPPPSISISSPSNISTIQSVQSAPIAYSTPSNIPNPEFKFKETQRSIITSDSTENIDRAIGVQHLLDSIKKR